MKQGVLIIMMLIVSSLSYSQQPYNKCSIHLNQSVTINEGNIRENSASEKESENDFESTEITDRSISVVPLGTSANAYSMLGNGRTYLWADPNLNAVVFTHRMDDNPLDSYGSNRLAYDISSNRGESGSWINNVQVYEPLGPGTSYPDAACRYPQGAIINPQGNTNQEEAYYTYFSPTLNDENSSWGGYAYGTNPLTAINPASPTQTNIGYEEGFYRYIPNAFTVTQQGVAWMVEPSYDVTNSIYTGKMIINKGVIDENGDVQYEEWLQDVLIEGENINDVKVAFAPDGQTGYILLMAESISDPQPYSNYHPILYETTDGGDNWSETPFHCQLGGPDGLDKVKEFISDEVLEELFGVDFSRDEIYYNMGFHADMIVDFRGNAHITGLITCATDDGSWYPAYGSMGTFHLIYDRELQTWESDFLYLNKTFEGELGSIKQYNRPQIGSDMDGRAFFISWLDTTLEGSGEEGNVYPDIFCTGKLVVNGIYSPVENVTWFTQAMYSAYFGTMSHYVFEESYYGMPTFTIPFAYTHMDEPQNPHNEVQFFYINDYSVALMHWDPGTVQKNDLNLKVKQNYPNPFNSASTITVGLNKSGYLSLEITNMLGQVLLKENKGSVGPGEYEFHINADDFASGTYFYTVKTNTTAVSKKMIVE